MYDRLLGSDHAEALVSIKMAEKSDFGQTRDLKGPGSSVRAQVEKEKATSCWQQGRLSSLLCNSDLMNTKKSKFTTPQPTNPLWANGKKCSAIRQKTNIIISQGFISRLPGLQGPGAFQDNSGAESWVSAAKPERKQRRQRRTFVLARKTTRDRLTEEKSSCVQQREEGGIRCREGVRVYCPPYWWG